jgi:drug/metabolite transporter (DMT)-like permease
MILVLLIWSGFSLTVRFIGASPLMIADVALIRFAVPVIVLFPLLFSRFNEIKKVKINDILVILLGGIPFLFLASLGAKTAPTAYVGTILAGTPPFFVALLSYILYRRTLPLKQMFTLSLILVGVLTMVVGLENEVSQDVLKGIGFLLSASVIWATYTIGLKRAGISAITVAIILSYSSFFIMLALMFCGVVSSNWGEFSVQQALPFILIQGLGVGILATIGFSYAVAQLGSARSSVIGALSPGITALLALPIFDEPLSIAIICGITITITGVILSNR